MEFAMKASHTKRTRPILRAKAHHLTATAKRTLAQILEAEIRGSPLNAQEFRARNERRIASLDQMARFEMLDRDGQTYALTFWGLLNTRGKMSREVLGHCRFVFDSLVRHYRRLPTTVLLNSQLEEQTGLTAAQVVMAVRIINRSIANVGLCTDPNSLGVMPSERHLAIRTFDRLKQQTRHHHSKPQQYWPTSQTLFTADGSAIVKGYIECCESQEVRDCWDKASRRLSTDLEGAITAARSLIESVSRYVLEDQGAEIPSGADLSRLFRIAAKSLELESDSSSHPAVRQVLGSCSGVVSGLAEMRNVFSDAHGKGTAGRKPGRRHAELAVLLAGAVTSFLLATLDAPRNL